METPIQFKTAKLAQEKGFNTEGVLFYELPSGDLINFKDNASQEFIDDCESGYRDKALNYFKEDYFRTYNNTDREGSEVLASSQSTLSKWLREEHNTDVQVTLMKVGYKEYKVEIYKVPENSSSYTHLFIKDGDYIKLFNIWEDAMEEGLFEALSLIVQNQFKLEEIYEIL